MSLPYYKCIVCKNITNLTDDPPTHNIDERYIPTGTCPKCYTENMISLL